MLNIAICDDEVRTASYIEELIYELCKRQNIDFNTEVFYSGKSILSYLEKKPAIDILYLDIEIPDMDGVNIAKTIRNMGSDIMIIYISFHDEYLINLFEVEPYRFIKKPISKKIFNSIFLKAYEKVKNDVYYFGYQYDKYHHKVKLNDILYFESINRTIVIHMMDHSKRFYGKLNIIEKELQHTKLSFLRIHQSYLINFSYVERLCYTTIIMTDGTELNISRNRRDKIRDKCHHLFDSFLNNDNDNE